MKRIIVLASVLAAAASSLNAQQAPADQIGRVVAIVGDSVVLNFDVQTGLLAWQQQTQTPVLPTGADLVRLQREIIESRVAELLMVQAAVKDTTIKITDEQIERYVQTRIDEDTRAIGGAVALEAALRESGRSMADYRQMLTTQTRKRALIENWQGAQRRNRKMPQVTEKEMREFFGRETPPMRPATIDFNQVVVLTTPSDSALAKARVKADSILAMLKDEDFATLARRYGQDASRESGGDLGWIKFSGVVKPFADAAFRMRAGDVSLPVLTQHGWHLIKVERLRGAERQVRHILIMPELSDNDAVRALARADSAAAQLRAGVDPDTVAFRFGDRDEPVRWPTSEVDTVQASLGVDLSAVKAGDVIGPIPRGGIDVASQFIVLHVVGRDIARPWRLEDAQLREQLRNQITRMKFEEELIEELKRGTYVEIREMPGGGAPD